MMYGEQRVSLEVHEFLTLVRTLEQQVAQLTEQLEQSKKTAGHWQGQASLWHAAAGSPRNARIYLDKYPETGWAPPIELHNDYKLDRYYLETGKPSE